MLNDNEIRDLIYRALTAYGAKYRLNNGEEITSEIANRFINVEKILQKTQDYQKDSDVLANNVKDQIKGNETASKLGKGFKEGGKVGAGAGAAYGAYQAYQQTEKAWRWGKTLWEGAKTVGYYGSGVGLIGGLVGLIGTGVVMAITTTNTDTTKVDALEKKHLNTFIAEKVKKALLKYRLANPQQAPDPVAPEVPPMQEAVVAPEVVVVVAKSTRKVNLKCPIGKELMTDPVLAPDGYSYERVELTNWYERGNRACPMNPGAELTPPETWITNQMLKSIIEDYRAFEQVKNNTEARRQPISEYVDLVPQQQNSGAGSSREQAAQR